MKNIPQSYPLEWLDLLITVTLNPSKTDIGAITDVQLNNIILRISEENLRLQLLIKSQIFSTNKENEIKLLIKQYHSSFIILLNQTLENQKAAIPKKLILKNTYKSLLVNIDELLSFIETHFANYLSPEEEVPETYLSVTRKELRKKLDRLKSKHKRITNPVMDIVLKRLYRFTDTNFTSYILK